jgi:hypothetical protein
VPSIGTHTLQRLYSSTALYNLSMYSLYSSTALYNLYMYSLYSSTASTVIQPSTTPLCAARALRFLTSFLSHTGHGTQLFYYTN